MPQSFKVYLDLDLDVAAIRILAQMDAARLANEQVHSDPKEYAAALQQRLESEARRYEALYGVNPYDVSHYDLVVDTAINNPDQVRSLIISEYKAWQTQ